MQNKMFIGNVGVLVEVIDALSVKAGRAAFDAMDLVAFFEEKF
jgi:hypothetical protein